MSEIDEGAAIDAEERALTLDHFDTEDAWWLGCHLRAEATRRVAPVAIEIHRGTTRLFTSVLPGATDDNLQWIRRKVAVAARFERSTYAIGIMMRASPGMFERFGLEHRSHTVGGGAVPIRVEGTGVVGVVAVSGMPQEVDHRLVIESLAALQSRQRGGDVDEHAS
jgi:uncharacterized protein (UPF0303 family)